MKAIFLAALALGMCSSPDIERLEQKVERLTERQAKNTSNMTDIENFVKKVREQYFKEATEDDKPEPIGVMANMFRFQIMLETYSVDWGGVYPNTIEKLAKDAKSSDYHVELENPYTGEKGWEKAVKSGSAKEGCESGMVYYHLVNQQNYEVTGCTIERTPALNEENKLLILSNS